MPPIRNTSFIPKSQDPKNAEPEPTDPFTIFGIVCLGVAIFFSVVSYGMTSYFENKNAQLASQISSFEKDLSGVPVKEMLAFYYKTKNINTVLKEHVYTSSILTILEDSVEQNVYFKKFEFSYRDGAGYNLNITGAAPDIRSVVRQIDTFKKDKYSKFFKTVQFVGLSTDQNTNTVNFEVNMSINPILPEDKLELEPNSNVLKTRSTLPADVPVTVPVTTTVPETSTSSSSGSTTSAINLPL